jgi:hypothetical protein
MLNGKSANQATRLVGRLEIHLKTKTEHLSQQASMLNGRMENKQSKSATPNTNEKISS